MSVGCDWWVLYLNDDQCKIEYNPTKKFLSLMSFFSNFSPVKSNAVLHMYICELV
jgi:uncharacterized protein YqkB